MKIVSTNHPIIINGVIKRHASEYLSADGVNVISSKDPIIVDGKRISNPSWYLSADGDEFYNAEGDNYSYLDQKNTADVKNFQDYLDAKKIGWVGATNPQKDNGKMLNRGRGYGTYGPSTANAYFVYGAEWEALKNPPQGTPSVTPTSTTAPSVTPVTTNVPQIPAGQQPTVAQLEEQKKKGIFWDKLKGTWITAKQSGVLDWLAGLVGIKLPQGQQGNLPPVGSPQYGSNTTDGKDRKLSRNAKIAIGLGGVLVVGLIIYSISKNRK